MATPTRLAHFACVTLIVGAPTVSTTYALDIIPQLQDEGENPSYDPDGSRLLAVFNAAAQIWERLLPFDSNEYEIDVSWGDLDDGTLGLHTFQFGGDNNIRIDPSPRQSDGDVLNWFIDASPLNHSEFNFNNPSPANPNSQGMTLYRDLSSSQQSDWFYGNAPPQVLEVGYRGAAIGTLPAEGSTAGSQGTVDMLSVVLHEIGHELGINSGDIEDGWEFEPEHVLNIPNVNIDETDGDGGGHFKASMTLMNPVSPSGTRILPTAADVLAIAWDESIASVDLQRKHFGSNVNTNWNSAPNWVGNRVPDTDDDAYLLRGTPVNLTANGSAGSLTLGNSTDLALLNHTLTVTGLTTVNSGSTVSVAAGGHAVLTSVNLAGGSASLNMQGGTASVGFLDVGVSASLLGRGVVNVSGFLANDGAILPINGPLHFQGLGPIDLDGYGDNGDVLAFSNLTIDNPIDDFFDGNMTVDDGVTVSLRDWTLGSPGNLILDGDPSNTTTLTSPPGFTADIRGDVTVDGNTVISSHNVQFYITSLVSIPNSNDRLELLSPGVTNFRGADFTGAGELEQQSTIQVLSDTTVATNTFDWGNSTNSTLRSIVVFSGQSLTIDSATAASGNNRFRGDLVLNSGAVAVNFDAPWELPDDVLSGPLPLPARPGRLVMNNTGGGTPTLSGQHVTIKNVVSVTGGPAIIAAPITTTNTANFFIDSGATLSLDGDVTLNAGFFNGPGTLRQLANIESFQDVVINTQTYDWGNSLVLTGTNATTIASDTQFIVLSSGTGTSGNPYHGVFNIWGGQLHTEFDEPWTLPDAAGAGATLRPRGVINFPFDIFGAVDTSFITGDDDEQLIVHGDINLFQPRAQIHVDTQFHPAAVVTVGDPSAAPDATLALYGRAEVFGATFIGPGTLEQAGHFTVLGDTNLDVNEFDWGNSSFSLAVLPNQLTVGPNATFTIDTPVLGDLVHTFRGIVNIVGGHLAVNTPGQWTLPEQDLFRGGTINFLNNRGVSDPLPSKLSGEPLFVEGRMHVEADLAIIDNLIVLFDAAEFDFAGRSNLQIGPSGNLEFHAIAIQHNDADATISSQPGATLNWPGFGETVTVQGNTAGSLTFDLAAGTTISLSLIDPPSLTIDPGATVVVAGQTDPFTSTFDPSVHMDVVNNSANSFVVASAAQPTQVTGTGQTRVVDGGTLSVGYIAQDRVFTEPGGTLIINTSRTSVDTTSGFTNVGTFITTHDTQINGPAAGAGDFIAPAGTDIRFNDPVSASGNFPGPGRILFRTAYTPNGAVYGVNHFGGNLGLFAAATLTLGAKTPFIPTTEPVAGTDHDQLNIANLVTLQGTLHVDFTPGGLFGDDLPPLGSEYVVMTYGTRDDGRGPSMFDAITGTLVQPDFALAPLFTEPADATDATATANSLILRASIPGDLNLDNKVSVADLSTFALHFNTTPGFYNEATGENSWELGDFNTDGAVTVADLSLLALNFGFDATDPANPLPGDGLTFAAAAALAGIKLPGTPIPEPTSAVTLLLTTALLTGSPRKAHYRTP